MLAVCLLVCVLVVLSIFMHFVLYPFIGLPAQVCLCVKVSVFNIVILGKFNYVITAVLNMTMFV